MGKVSKQIVWQSVSLSSKHSDCRIQLHGSTDAGQKSGEVTMVGAGSARERSFAFSGDQRSIERGKRGGGKKIRLGLCYS